MWYALTGVIVIVGVLLVALAKGGNSNTARPQVGDHWHAALGVYMCDHWQGGTNGSNWLWPSFTAAGSPARAGTSAYAGLHSHGDGIIHIEPQTSDEIGKHATVGTYFKFGGWHLSDTKVTFVGETKTNGDKCGSEPGLVRWAVNGAEQKGNPANYKINDGDEIMIAFVPKTTNLKSLGHVPSLANLATALNREGNSQLPSSATTMPTVPQTTAPKTTPTTAAKTTPST
jgi:hypothetical protein